MEDSRFRFKSFEVSHHRSSMKVGVDAVLLGAWAGINPKKILDVGTGCGVISLMLSQRFLEATVDAIDIDENSIEEAKENFDRSLWNNRLRVCLANFAEFSCHFRDNCRQYDLIVSNPPYFDSGIENPVTSREKARHQSSLSVFSLLEKSKDLMAESGRLSMIFPAEFYEKVRKVSERERYVLLRECRIRNRPEREEKRVMMEFGKRDFYEDVKFETKHLVMFEGGEPTEEYRHLCKDFYLKF